MRGHVKRIRDGVYRIVYDTPRGLDGKRKLKTETVSGNKRHAEVILNQRITTIQRGEYVDAGSLTVQETFERYLRSTVASLAGTTHQRYASAFKTHIGPALGRLKLSVLSPLHLEEAYSTWLRSGRMDKEGGLSPQTVLHYHRIIHRVLNQAVKWNVTSRNVADAVEPPKPRRREMNVLSAQALMRLVGTALNPSSHALAQGGLSAESAFSAAVVFLAFSGARRGECLALKWEDVDLKAGSIAIRRSLEQTKESIKFKAPKNNRGRRIQLPQFALDALQRHKAKQNAYRLALGDGYKDQGLVFARPDGSIINPHAFGDAFRALVKRSDVASIRLHDLRHTHATLMLKAGVQGKVTQERLGHSGIGITMDLYSHVMPGMDADASQRFEDALLEGAEQEASATGC
jgi:integrase